MALQKAELLDHLVDERPPPRLQARRLLLGPSGAFCEAPCPGFQLFGRRLQPLALRRGVRYPVHGLSVFLLKPSRLRLPLLERSTSLGYVRLQPALLRSVRGQEIGQVRLLGPQRLQLLPQLVPPRLQDSLPL